MSITSPVTLAILTPRATRAASRLGGPGWPTLSPLALQRLALQRLTLQRITVQSLPQLQTRAQRLVQRLALQVVGPANSAPRAASALEVWTRGGRPRALARAACSQ